MWVRSSWAQSHWIQTRRYQIGLMVNGVKWAYWTILNNNHFVLFLISFIHSLIHILNWYRTVTYAASFLKIQTPAPYRLRNSSDLQYGINFAYGGTGVFQTLVDGPNMTLQIDSLEQLIQQNIYTRPDLESSVALVSAAGNDYTAFVVKNRSITVSVVKLIIFIYTLLYKKILIAFFLPQ